MEWPARNSRRRRRAPAPLARPPPWWRTLSTRGRLGRSRLALNRSDLNRVRPAGREHRAGHGDLLLCELLQPVVLAVARHGGRRRAVELAVFAKDREQDPLASADLRTLTVAVPAQPLTELARNVHHGPGDGPLTTLGVVHRHGLRCGDTGARQTEPAGDGGDGKHATEHTALPLRDHVEMSRRTWSSSARGGPGSRARCRATASRKANSNRYCG